MTEHGEIEAASREFARLASTALRAAQTAAIVIAARAERASQRTDRARRDAEGAQRHHDALAREAEREQRMREGVARIGELEARRRHRHHDAGQRRAMAADGGSARDVLAARWAAAEALRRLDPDAVDAWDGAMRDAGVDPDDIRRLATAANASRATYSDCAAGTARGAEDTGAGVAKQLAMDFVDDYFANRESCTEAASAGAERTRDQGSANEGSVIGATIAAADHDTGSGCVDTGVRSAEVSYPAADFALEQEAVV